MLSSMQHAKPLIKGKGYIDLRIPESFDKALLKMVELIAFTIGAFI